MKLGGRWSEKVVAVVRANPDLHHSVEDGDDAVVKLYENHDGEVEVHIVLGPEPTARLLRKAIPLALTWHDRITRQGYRLQSGQGYRLLSGRENFLERLLMYRKGGEKNPQIAERINRKLRELVREHFSPFKRESARVVGVRARASIDAALTDAFDAQDRARWTLRQMGMNEKETTQTFGVGLERVETGRALDTWKPVTTEKVTAVLDHWEHSKKRRAYLAALDATMQNARSEANRVSRDGARKESRR